MADSIGSEGGRIGRGTSADRKGDIRPSGASGKSDVPLLTPLRQSAVLAPARCPLLDLGAQARRNVGHARTCPVSFRPQPQQGEPRRVAFRGERTN
jgi:hypothetical protein